MTAAQAQITCTQCGAAHPPARKDGTIPPLKFRGDGTPAIPKGWYVDGDTRLCRACRGGMWRIGAVSFPVRGPDDLDRQEFVNQLRTAWRCASEFCTLTERLLYVDDDGWIKDAKKFAELPKVSCTTLRAAMPDYLPSAAAVQMQTMVTTRYAKRRSAIHRDRSDTPSVYRDPSPIAFRYDRAKLTEGADGRLYVSLPWVSGGRIVLELLNGGEFRRQMESVRRVLAGESRLRMVILQPQMCRGESGGAVKVFYRRSGRAMNDVYRPMLKLVIEERRRPRGDQEGEATITTGRWPLLRMTGDRLPRDGFVWHGQALAKVIRMRERRQLHLREDRKAVTGASRQACARKIGDAALKDARRMDAALKQLVAQVADKAMRIRVKRVWWENTDKSFAESFPWTQLRALMKIALGKHNIELADAESAGG